MNAIAYPYHRSSIFCCLYICLCFFLFCFFLNLKLNTIIYLFIYFLFIFKFHSEKQLNALLRMYDENETEICNALAADLRKSRQESIINEVELLRNDVRNLLMNLREYAKPEYVMQIIHFILHSLNLILKINIVHFNFNFNFNFCCRFYILAGKNVCIYAGYGCHT